MCRRSDYGQTAYTNGNWELESCRSCVPQGPDKRPRIYSRAEFGFPDLSTSDKSITEADGQRQVTTKRSTVKLQDPVKYSNASTPIE